MPRRSSVISVSSAAAMGSHRHTAFSQGGYRPWVRKLDYQEAHEPCPVS